MTPCDNRATRCATSNSQSPTTVPTSTAGKSQPGLPTIQGALADAASQITQEKVFIQGASRTDTGVHALGQVAHFKTQSGLAAAEFQRALNALLPPTIRIVAAEEVGPDFHARWQAQGKTYRYRIYRGRSAAAVRLSPRVPLFRAA